MDASKCTSPQRENVTEESLKNQVSVEIAEAHLSIIADRIHELIGQGTDADELNANIMKFRAELHVITAVLESPEGPD